MLLQECKECGKKGFADLRSHLRKHKITWQEYIQKYGEKPKSLNIIDKIPNDVKMIDLYQRDMARRLRG